MIKHIFAWWKFVAIIALFFILITFLLEFFVHLTVEQQHLLELLDIIAIIILAIDLAIHYLESKQKKHFFRRNWILVVSLFPFAQFLRFVKVFRVLGMFIANSASKLFHVFTHSTRFVRGYRVFAVWFGKRKKMPVKKKLKQK